MPKAKKTGRPTVMTSEVLQKLEYAFASGLSDREASLYAGISESTLYNYCNKNEEFLERKALLKEHTKMRAKLVIAKAIEEGSVRTAQWYLERKAKDEFSTRQEAEVAMQTPVFIVDDLPSNESL